MAPHLLLGNRVKLNSTAQSVPSGLVGSSDLNPAARAKGTGAGGIDYILRSKVRFHSSKNPYTAVPSRLVTLFRRPQS